MRAYLARWFALGETMQYTARQDCVAGAFRLVDIQVGSSLPVVSTVPRAVSLLETHGAMALNRPDQPPDTGMTMLTNANRSFGYRMRRAALEGRICMDTVTASAFGYALRNPRAFLAFDTQAETLMLMDPGTGVLVVTRGAQ